LLRRIPVFKELIFVCRSY